MSDLKVIIGADISQLQSEMAKAGGVTQAFAAKSNTAIATTTASTNKLASSFKGIGTSLLSLVNPETLVLTGLLAIGAAVYEFATSETEAARSVREFNDAMDEAESSVAGNVARLQALVSIAQDVTRSDDARKEALGALNKEYDGFNGKLTLANINTKESITLIDQQTQAIVRQAKIKGVQDLIVKESQKQAQLLTRDLEDNLSFFQKVKIAALGVSAPALSSAAAIAEGLKEQDKQFKESEDIIKNYSEILKRLLGEDAEQGTLFKEKPTKEATQKSVKNVETISDVLRKLQLEITALNAKEVNLKTNEAQAKIRAIQGAIDELIKKLGVASNSPLILNLFARIKDIQFTEKLKENLKTSVGDTDLKIAPKITLTPVIKNTGWLQDILDQNAIDAKKLADFGKKLSDIMQSTIGDALVGIGEAIGESIGGGGNFFGSLFSAIFKSIGAGLKQLGAYAIATSKLIIAIKATIGTTLGIAGGIALIALGSLISAAASKIKGPAFATGVRNFGGGTALVGERGPELVNLPRGSEVVTNGRLNSMGGGELVVTGRIVAEGTQLAVVLDRARAYNSRNF